MVRFRRFAAWEYMIIKNDKEMSLKWQSDSMMH